MNTYKTKINAVDAYVSRDGLQNVIYNVHYSYIGEDPYGRTSSQIGVHSLKQPDPENFKPFDQLVQADIIAWIEAELPIESMQKNIDSMLAELAAPTRVTLQIPESLENIEVQEEVVDNGNSEEI